MNQNLPIYLALAHFFYYLYFQLISDLIKIGQVTYKNNSLIEDLRAKYGVQIKTFQNNNVNHHGFAWFNTIFLNETLLRDDKKLLWAYYHELYHIRFKHKRNILLHRLLIACIPLMLYLNWIAALVVYIGAAYLIEVIRQRYEVNANKFADEMYLKKEINIDYGKKRKYSFKRT